MTEGHAENQTNRFCENCGAEIGPTVNFCPNCGAQQRPRSEVPPDSPPQIPETGQTSAPSAASVPPTPPTNRGLKWPPIVLGGCGVLVLLFVLLVACTALLARGGGSGNSPTTTEQSNEQTKEKQRGSGSGATTTQQSKEQTKQKAQKQGGGTKVAIGQPATVADASWVVTSAQPRSELRSQFGSQSKQGNFIVVDFTFTNNGNEAKTLTPTIMALYDNSGRKSSPDTDTFSEIPNDKDIFITQVNPGVTKDGEVIFSVAPGASGFTLELSNTNFLKGDKADVNLGF